MVIYYIPGSKFAENCPTTRIQVDLGVNVEPRKVFDSLLQFDQRKLWDTSIKNIELEEIGEGQLHAYI